MRQGTIVWQVPLGTIEDLVPAIVPNLKLGVPNLGGPILTGSGLVFIAAAMDNYLRAFDSKNGDELWKGRLPAGGQATPGLMRRLVRLQRLDPHPPLACFKVRLRTSSTVS